MSESTRGQSNRKRIMDEMKNRYSELIPNYNEYEIVTILADEFNLSPDTITYGYMRILKRNFTLEGLKDNPDAQPYLEAKKKLKEEEKKAKK
jgi:hypothetical protein